jgi:hypothetical protein
MLGRAQDVLDQDVANLRATVETLQSQITLSNIKMLPGQKSDADLALLAKAVQSIDLSQDKEVIKKKLKEVQRLGQKNRTLIAKRYGIPDTVPDTPDVEVDIEEKEALLKKYVHRRGNRGQYGGGE